MNNKEKLEKLKEIVEGNVGYKNPPKHSQFKKGQSGNPAGRKKKVIPKSLYEAFAIYGNEIKSLNTGNGASQKFTILELIVKKSLQDAIQKDGPTRKFILDNFMKVDFNLLYKTLLEQEKKQAKYDEYKEELKNAILAKLNELAQEEENKN